MTEVFREIEGYEGFYQVSNLGRIKSKKQILTPTLTKDGYLRIQLWKNAHWKMFMIHRLVANTFIPNPNNLPEINHKDENKTNNRVDNLEWCTREYNQHYGTCIERRNKTHMKPVLCVETGIVYSNLNEITLPSISHINECCNGKRKTAYGYHWQFVDNQ